LGRQDVRNRWARRSIQKMRNRAATSGAVMLLCTVLMRITHVAFLVPNKSLSVPRMVRFPGPREVAVARRGTMISIPGDIKNGIKMDIDGTPYQVVSFLSKKVGKGVAITKAKVMDLYTGAIIEKSLQSGSKYEAIDTEWVDATYSYYDEGNSQYMFMNSETYEEIPLAASILGDSGEWLVEGNEVELESYAGTTIKFRFKGELILDIKEVVDTGRSDGSVQAVLSNGVTKQGPSYLKVGDKVLIDQDTFAIKKRL